MSPTCLFSSQRLTRLASSLVYSKRCGLLLRRGLSSKILTQLKERGILKEWFPDKDSAGEMLGQKQTLYAGFDPTSDSLHLGNLLILMSLLHMTREGHQVICVIGEGTAAVGDPSGRSTQRESLSRDAIRANAEAISSDINKVFANHYKYFWKPKFNSPLNEPIILNNESWYKGKNVIDFVSKVGRNIRVADMMAKSFVKDRVDSKEGITLSEFCYQCFQAYDWLYLLERYDCRFQVGGSDQLGNITTGYDLIRKGSQKAIHGLLTPLVTNQVGDKYGKSAGSAVWLNREKLSPFEFYQFFIRLPDTEVEKFIKLFTFLSEDQVEQTMQKFLKAAGSRLAQQKLAEQVTLLVHGEEGLNLAKKTTKALYEEDIESIGRLSREEMREIFGSAFSCSLFLEPGETTVLDLALKAKCFSNQTDAARTIKEGGFWINYKKVVSLKDMVGEEHILPNNTSLLKVGKRRFYIINWH